jgi:3-dehydroquinate dehydratase-2
MLGVREPEIYGSETLKDIEDKIAAAAGAFGFEAEFFQSDGEGAIIGRIHAAYGAADALIINAGAYTHYSYAIADALKILKCPKIEVHISDLKKRERFRRKSVLKPAVHGCVMGQGTRGYITALQRCAELLSNE